MARTTKADVATIIELDDSIIPDDAAMLPFITIANELVTELCTGTTNGPTTAYTDVRLELIERYLTAHFYTNRDPRSESEKAGSVGASYQSKVDLGFDTSHYGQTAMRLDTNGQLARVNKDMKNGGVPKARVSWLGYPCTQQEVSYGCP